MSIEVIENSTENKPAQGISSVRKSRVLLWVTMLTVASILSAFFSPKALTLTDKLTLHATIMVVGLCVWTAFVLYFKAKGDPHLFVDVEKEQEIAETAEFGGNLKESRAELVSLAYTDRLTRLGNQQRMMEKFKSMADNRRQGDKGFLVGVADMDGMKPINDLYGFDGGDEILKQCAQRLSAAIDKDGFVFRIRGDEFGFLLPDIKDQEGANHIGKILQEVLNAPFDLDGRTVRLSGSFGFAVYPDAGHSYEAVMKNIESALYHSKCGGRGRITVFSKEIEDIILENARMEQALRRAIANNEVRPHFQPIISLQDGKLLDFEALARWIDAEHGFVSPAKFIPLAEERGIIASLTDKLLLHAAKVASAWPDEIFLSFNLSRFRTH